MSILKYKYKAHKFINYAFYIVVFIIGFLLGFSTKKINFNKLISQVLMIDNVQAYNLTTYNGNAINEQFIYNRFIEKWTNFDIEKYNNIYCDYYSSGSTHTLTCRAFTDETRNSFSCSGTVCSIANNQTDMYEFVYTLNKSSFSSSSFIISENQNSYSSAYFFYANNSSRASASNYNRSDLSSSANANFNKFDFSNFIIKLEFNENLFKDNPDFKQVCVDSSKYFVISSDSYVNEQTIFSDFLWFPHGLYGLYQASYYTDSKEIFYQENESATYHYYFTNKEVINENFSQNNGLNYLLFDNSYYKYEDRYLYYGWTAYPFAVDYNESYISLPVYYFENPITYNSLGDNIHGGGGIRLDGDEEIEISNEYCFYIKNNYHVEYLKVDEFNNFQGSIITPNGTIEIDSTNNKNNNTGNFLSQPKNFINSMKDTINFINSLIYEFYISLPLLLRTFIITLLIILIIMLIMKIGGYS